MIQDLRGKVAMVTGAGSGIGLALCEAAGGSGMRVAMTDADVGRLRRAAADLRDQGLDVCEYQLDVTDRAAWRDIADRVECDLGGVSLLCNNAGISALGVRVQDMDWAYWDLTVRINLDGVFNGVRTLLPRMLQRGERAHIVNTASAAALASPPDGAAAYAASKYGVLGLSEALRMDLAGTPVSISVLCPGAVRTNLWQSTRQMRGLAELNEVPAESASRSGSPNAMSPSAVAERVLEAVQTDRFLIMTHASYRSAVERQIAERRTALDLLG